jgi:AcrR family transcriptional regulator
MRQRLLEATVELLVERGWSGTSTTLVSKRAGVSLGAQLHHFPTKNDLVLAAVEHLSEVRGRELAEAATKLPTGRRRTRAVLEMLAEHFTSPVFIAALELWVAARTDETLLANLAPLEQRIGRDIHRRTVELSVSTRTPGPRAGPGDADRPRSRLATTATTPPAETDPRRVGPHPRRPDPCDPRGEPMSTTPTQSALCRVVTDLVTEGDVVDELVSRLDDAGWRTPTPAEGWDVAHQIAHLAWTDEMALNAATDKEAWDASVLKALEDPDGFVDKEADRLSRLDPAELLPRWPRARRSPTPCSGSPRAPSCPGTAADERHVDGDGAVHGRPGPTG